MESVEDLKKRIKELEDEVEKLKGKQKKESQQELVQEEKLLGFQSALTPNQIMRYGRQLIMEQIGTQG
jgi:hypothetical protein